MKKLLIFIASMAILAPAIKAQNTNATQTFVSSFVDYFTSFDTNSTTFQATGSFWTGMDSINGNNTPLAASIGLSYRLYKKIDVETVIRNSGVAGVVMSWQGGLSFNVVKYDAKLTGYLDGGYLLDGSDKNNVYGEVGLRVQKALTQNTYAGTGIGVQFPNNTQVFQVLAGFTF